MNIFQDMKNYYLTFLLTKIFVSKSIEGNVHLLTSDFNFVEFVFGVKPRNEFGTIKLFAPNVLLQYTLFITVLFAFWNRNFFLLFIFVYLQTRIAHGIRIPATDKRDKN